MNNPRKIYRQFNDEKLEQIRNHPYYAGVREDTLRRADALLEKDPPRIRFSHIHLYATTGDRGTFEQVYFHYLERMNTLYLAYLISEEEKYLTELSDTIWNICNFESWTLPAHISEADTVARRRNFIALFSAAAAASMSEILYFIGDKLPELVVRRAKAEIQYRTIDSYAKNHCPFEHVKHNWAPVCTCAVFCTYLYLATDEEIEAQLPRMIKTMDNYIDGYMDDCCCSEGLSYWCYGFTNLIVFASMLKDYTDGKINYFDNPKVKKIAMFRHRVRLSEKDSVMFSDGVGIGYKIPRYLDHILKANYPDYPLTENDPPMQAVGASPMEERGDSRSLFCVNPDFVGEKIKFENDIFENVQWFMYHGKDYSVGAKAGHNNEFHNHNDVGSFMLSKGGVISFYDAGPGIYNKQYFAPETRYTIMRCSSLGHSAPIINGEAQKEGNRGICDIFALDREGHFAFDMKKAYVVDTLELLKREFNCNEDYFTITDTYEFSEMPSALVERFVSREPVRLEDGVIKTGNSTLVFDSDALVATTGSFSAQEGSKSVIHHVDFTPKKLDKNMSFTFKFI